MFLSSRQHHSPVGMPRRAKRGGSTAARRKGIAASTSLAVLSSSASRESAAATGAKSSSALMIISPLSSTVALGELLSGAAAERQRRLIRSTALPSIRRTCRPCRSARTTSAEYPLLHSIRSACTSNSPVSPSIPETLKCVTVPVTIFPVGISTRPETRNALSMFSFAGQRKSSRCANDHGREKTKLHSLDHVRCG